MGSSPIRPIQSVSEGALAPSRQNFENSARFSELAGDFPPKERFFETEAAVDSDDSGVAEAGGAGDFRDDFGPEGRIASQQAQGNHGVGFAAAHRLFEFEDGLIGFATEPLKALAQEGFHAFGDVVLVEERHARAVQSS